MKTLIIYLENADQELAIQQFLDALHVSYKSSNEIDETDYIISSPVMVQHLHESEALKERGEGVKITLDEIWK